MLEELEQSCFDTPGWDHPWHSCLLLFFFFIATSNGLILTGGIFLGIQ